MPDQRLLPTVFFRSAVSTSQVGESSREDLIVSSFNDLVEVIVSSLVSQLIPVIMSEVISFPVLKLQIPSDSIEYLIVRS